MRSRLAGISSTIAALAALSCSGASGSLTRGQRAFEQGEHERALAIFRDLEADVGRLSRTERVRYAYLRGMTDYRLGDKTDARHWLALAQALETATPRALEPEWAARMNESLGELNEDAYAAAEAAALDAPPPPPSSADGGKP
jgi:hypothetical protein